MNDIQKKRVYPVGCITINGIPKRTKTATQKKTLKILDQKM